MKILIKSLFAGIAALILFGSCSVFDNKRLIATPMDNQSVRGVQTIAVTAPENFPVDYADFSIDGTKVAQDSSSPYSYEWDTHLYANGAHTISVDLYAVDGRVESDKITVYVEN